MGSGEKVLNEWVKERMGGQRSGDTKYRDSFKLCCKRKLWECGEKGGFFFFLEDKAFLSMDGSGVEEKEK